MAFRRFPYGNTTTPLNGLANAGGLNYQLGLQKQADDERQSELATNPMSGMDAIGPLHDPTWDAWFQSLKNQGVGALAGGSAPEGSNQIRGYSTQPDYLTTDRYMMGRPNPNYQGTMFAPGQQSAIDGTDYNQQRAWVGAMHGLRGAYGRT